MNNTTTNAYNFYAVTDLLLMTNCSLDILNDLVEDIEALYSISIVLGIIHCVTAITSTFANGLVIAAILKTPSLHTPSNVLLCGLAFTDFLVGAVTQPAAVALLTGRILKNYQLFCTAHLTQFVAGYFFIRGIFPYSNCSQCGQISSIKVTPQISPTCYNS